MAARRQPLPAIGTPAHPGFKSHFQPDRLPPATPASTRNSWSSRTSSEKSSMDETVLVTPVAIAKDNPRKPSRRISCFPSTVQSSPLDRELLSLHLRHKSAAISRRYADSNTSIINSSDDYSLPGVSSLTYTANALPSSYQSYSIEDVPRADRRSSAETHVQCGTDTRPLCRHSNLSFSSFITSTHHANRRTSAETNVHYGNDIKGDDLVAWAAWRRSETNVLSGSCTSEKEDLCSGLAWRNLGKCDNCGREGNEVGVKRVTWGGKEERSVSPLDVTREIGMLKENLRWVWGKAKKGVGVQGSVRAALGVKSGNRIVS